MSPVVKCRVAVKDSSRTGLRNSSWAVFPRSPRGPTEVILDLGGLEVRAYASAIAQRLPQAEQVIKEETVVEQGQR